MGSLQTMGLLHRGDVGPMLVFDGVCLARPCDIAHCTWRRRGDGVLFRVSQVTIDPLGSNRSSFVTVRLWAERVGAAAWLTPEMMTGGCGAPRWQLQEHEEVEVGVVALQEQFMIWGLLDEHVPRMDAVIRC